MQQHITASLQQHAHLHMRPFAAGTLNQIQTKKKKRGRKKEMKKNAKAC